MYEEEFFMLIKSLQANACKDLTTIGHDCLLPCPVIFILNEMYCLMLYSQSCCYHYYINGLCQMNRCAFFVLTAGLVEDRVGALPIHNL